MLKLDMRVFRLLLLGLSCLTCMALAGTPTAQPDHEELMAQDYLVACRAAVVDQLLVAPDKRKPLEGQDCAGLLTGFDMGEMKTPPHTRIHLRPDTMEEAEITVTLSSGKVYQWPPDLTKKWVSITKNWIWAALINTLALLAMAFLPQIPVLLSRFGLVLFGVVLVAIVISPNPFDNPGTYFFFISLIFSLPGSVLRSQHHNARYAKALHLSRLVDIPAPDHKESYADGLGQSLLVGIPVAAVVVFVHLWTDSIISLINGELYVGVQVAALLVPFMTLFVWLRLRG